MYLAPAPPPGSRPEFIAAAASAFLLWAWLLSTLRAHVQEARRRPTLRTHLRATPGRMQIALLGSSPHATLNRTVVLQSLPELSRVLRGAPGLCPLRRSPANHVAAFYEGPAVK